MEERLAGAPLSLEDLVDVIEGTHEDQFLEIKSQCPGKRPPAEFIREYVSGFANADGGVLVLGASDRVPRELLGFPSPNGQPVPSWVNDCLSPISEALALPPRYAHVRCPGGDVWTVAIGPAPRLIEVIEGGRRIAYRRNGDRTIELSPSLRDDLVLGRRSSPVITLQAIVKGEWDEQWSEGSEAPMGKVRALRIRCNLVNDSMVGTEQVVVGIIGWTVTGRPSPLSAELLKGIDLVEISADARRFVGASTWLPVCRRWGSWETRLPGLPPFEDASTKEMPPFYLPIYPKNVRVSMAAYVIPAGRPPAWYQITFQLDHGSPYAQDVRAERVWFSRPMVSWAVVEPVQC